MNRGNGESFDPNREGYIRKFFCNVLGIGEEKGSKSIKESDAAPEQELKSELKENTRSRRISLKKHKKPDVPPVQETNSEPQESLPDVPSTSSEELQAQREEKLRLEYAISKLVGGSTGLLMTLDILLYDVQEKKRTGFQGHAEGYLWKTDRLEKLLEQYEKVTGEEQKKSYQGLFTVGEYLRGKLAALSSDGLTDEELDSVKKYVLDCIDLYDD